MCRSSAGKCLPGCERGSPGRGGMRRERESVWRRGEGGGVRRSRAGREGSGREKGEE